MLFLVLDSGVVGDPNQQSLNKVPPNNQDIKSGQNLIDDNNEEDEEEETEPANDYVINVGDSWDDLTPQQTFAAKQVAISIAKAMSKAQHDKCVEVVYSPCDDVDTNEIIWRNQN